MKQIINWSEYSESEIRALLKEGEEILVERNDYRKAELVRQINEAAAALKREFPGCQYWEDTWDEEETHYVGFDMMEYFPMDPTHLH